MIYVSSACLKKDYIKDVIVDLAEHNIKNIEFSGGTKYYSDLEQDIMTLKNKYQLNYACHAYFPPPKDAFVVNLASCNDEIYNLSIKHYENCIEMLSRIGCHVLSVHAGFFVEVGAEQIGNKLDNKIIYDENEAYDRFCSAYENIVRKCKVNGIQVYLENNVLSKENYIAFNQNNYLMMTDYNSILKMKKLIDFELLLDLGHLHVSANTLGLSFEKECSLLKESIRWIHLSENNGVIDQHKPLQKDSAIMKEFYKMENPQIPVTLETVGTMDDIIRSYNLTNGIR